MEENEEGVPPVDKGRVSYPNPIPEASTGIPI
jgi:hypothetical protein